MLVTTFVDSAAYVHPKAHVRVREAIMIRSVCCPSSYSKSKRCTMAKRVLGTVDRTKAFNKTTCIRSDQCHSNSLCLRLADNIGRATSSHFYFPPFFCCTDAIGQLTPQQQQQQHNAQILRQKQLIALQQQRQRELLMRKNAAAGVQQQPVRPGGNGAKCVFLTLRNNMQCTILSLCRV